MNFEHDYLVMDEFGEKTVLCMNCEKPIKERIEAMGKFGTIRELGKHPEYREIPVLLSNNSIAFVMVCADCKFVEIGENESVLITKQVSNARKQQLEWKGLSPDIVEPLLEKLNLPVLRKADVHEVMAAMRNT